MPRPSASRPPARDVGGSFSVVGVEAALAVAAEALPRIVPNVLINKREGAAGAWTASMVHANNCCHAGWFFFLENLSLNSMHF